MVVPVEPGPTLQIGAATPLIEGNFSGRRDLRSYDVSPDGQRFLLLKPSGAATDEPGVGPRAILVQGWFDELGVSSLLPDAWCADPRRALALPTANRRLTNRGGHDRIPVLVRFTCRDRTEEALCVPTIRSEAAAMAPFW